MSSRLGDVVFVQIYKTVCYSHKIIKKYDADLEAGGVGFKSEEAKIIGQHHFNSNKGTPATYWNNNTHFF